MIAAARDKVSAMVSKARYAVFVLGLAATAAILAARPSAAAGDAKAGREKAVQCQACHGLDGLAKVPGAPHIAGQPIEYLIKSMTDYKTGARKNELMSIVMPQVSAQDIADLAAYYAAIEVVVKAPP
jgi:cytochrome c553